MHNLADLSLPQHTARCLSPCSILGSSLVTARFAGERSHRRLDRRSQLCSLRLLPRHHFLLARITDHQCRRSRREGPFVHRLGFSADVHSQSPDSLRGGSASRSPVLPPSTDVVESRFVCGRGGGRREDEEKRVELFGGDSFRARGRQEGHVVITNVAPYKLDADSVVF